MLPPPCSGVVDVERGRLLANRTVLVRGRRIAAVTPSGAAPVPPGVRAVDARGLYVLPGLWDMHAHAPGGPPGSPGDAMARRLFLPLHLAHGVTGVRHMFGTDGERRQQGDVAAGRLLGPRLVVGSPLVDGPRPMWGGAVAVGTAAAAARAVDSLAAQGYAFIKAYQFLPPDAYRGLLAAARRRGLPVAGHVPFAVGAAEAADAGQRSIEHGSGVLLACSAEEAALRPALAAAAAAVDTSFAAHAALWARGEVEPAATFDTAIACARRRVRCTVPRVGGPPGRLGRRAGFALRGGARDRRAPGPAPVHVGRCRGCARCARPVGDPRCAPASGPRGARVDREPAHPARR